MLAHTNTINTENNQDLPSMHQLHLQAAEQHELAATLHRTIAASDTPQDTDPSSPALESSSRAYALAQQALNQTETGGDL
jgi:hypothetical protein